MSHDIKVIGDYQVYFNRFIGKGSYGKVYEGKVVSQNKIICVKVLQLTYDKREMFQREVTILEGIKKITHPNILKIYHIAEQNQKIYIFMEKCLKNLEEELQNMIKEKKQFSVDQVLQISKQICRGYNELRKQDIIHRDLKPENILKGEDGYYKISDYGLSKFQDNIESIVKQTQLGTPLFVSPQVLQEGKYSNKADLFSFGLTIYYLTFQKSIFQIKSIGDLYHEFKKMKNGINIPQIQIEGDEKQKSYLLQLFQKTIQYEEDERMSWDQLSKYLEQIPISSSISTNNTNANNYDNNQESAPINLKLQKIKKDSFIYSIKPSQNEKTQINTQQPVKNANQDYENCIFQLQQNTLNNQDNYQVNYQIKQQQQLDYQTQQQNIDQYAQDQISINFFQEENYQKQNNNNPVFIKQYTNDQQLGYQVKSYDNFQEDQAYNQINQNEKFNLDYNYQQDNYLDYNMNLKNSDLYQNSNSIQDQQQNFRESNQQNYYIINNTEKDNQLYNIKENNTQSLQFQNEQLKNDKTLFSNCNYNYDKQLNNSNIDILQKNEIDTQSQILSDNSYTLSQSIQKDQIRSISKQNFYHKLRNTIQTKLQFEQDIFDKNSSLKKQNPEYLSSQSSEKIKQVQNSFENKTKQDSFQEITSQNKSIKLIFEQPYQEQQTYQKQNEQQYNYQQYEQQTYQQQYDQEKYQQQFDQQTYQQQYDYQPEYEQQAVLKNSQTSKQQDSYIYINNISNQQQQQQKVQEVQNQYISKGKEVTNNLEELYFFNDKQPENQQLIQQQNVSKQNEKQKSRLIKRADINQPGLWLEQIFQIIFSKIKLAQNILNSSSNIRTQQILQKFTKQFEIFNYLLCQYQFSLIANVRLLCRNDKDKGQCYLKKELEQFIDLNNMMDYQSQISKYMSQINDIYQEKLLLSTQASQKLQDFLDSRSNNTDVIELIRFFEQGDFNRYQAYIELYQKYFRSIFEQFYDNINSPELLKFFGYSIKFIWIDREYPIKNYKTINCKSIEYISNDEQCLKDFITNYKNIK